ncbi:MAG: hypothetical protein ACXABY_30465, partial [Candidatus Thorarchaeota archaeon]
MPYEQLVSRARPALILMLVDDSLSMQEHLPGTSTPKYEYVERYDGILLEDLLGRSTEGNGRVKPRYYIHVIKYGGKVEIWGDPGMDIEAAIRKFTGEGNSLGLGGNLGGTDAKGAFQEAYAFLQQALSTERFLDSFPPIVLHLTDGESQTDATAESEKVKQLSTSDGNVLVVNAYIGTQTNLSYQGPEDFPGYLDVSEAGSSHYNVRLFEMSSVAPETIETNLKADDIFPQFR